MHHVVHWGGHCTHLAPRLGENIGIILLVFLSGVRIQSFAVRIERVTEGAGWVNGMPSCAVVFIADRVRASSGRRRGFQSRPYVSRYIRARQLASGASPGEKSPWPFFPTLRRLALPLGGSGRPAGGEGSEFRRRCAVRGAGVERWPSWIVDFRSERQKVPSWLKLDLFFRSLISTGASMNCIPVDSYL